MRKIVRTSQACGRKAQPVPAGPGVLLHGRDQDAGFHGRAVPDSWRQHQPCQKSPGAPCIHRIQNGIQDDHLQP